MDKSEWVNKQKVSLSLSSDGSLPPSAPRREADENQQKISFQRAATFIKDIEDNPYEQVYLDPHSSFHQTKTVAR
jgi:hypothetical protein